jgi:hypothetical protein
MNKNVNMNMYKVTCISTYTVQYMNLNINYMNMNMNYINNLNYVSFLN